MGKKRHYCPRSNKLVPVSGHNGYVSKVGPLSACCPFGNLHRRKAWQKSTGTDKSLHKTENGSRAIPRRGYVRVCGEPLTFARAV